MNAKLIRIATIASLAAAALVGSSATAVGPGELSFTITGRVLKDGLAVPNAFVQAQSVFATSPRGRLRAITGSDGRFSMGDVDPGSYSMRGYRYGYGTGRAIAVVGVSAPVGASRTVTIRLR